MATNSILQPGATAPDFTLRCTPDVTLRLSELRGRPVVLAFYQADWSPVCGEQMSLYNEMHEEFAEYGAQVVGVSVDGVWCHRAFARAKHIHFPLLADSEPKGEVSSAYGAYDDERGTSKRALFVIAHDSVIRWSYLSPTGVNPGAEGILHALESLTAPSVAASRSNGR